MTLAEPATLHQDRPPQDGSQSRFRRRVAELTGQHMALWRRVGADPPLLGPPIGAWRRWRNDRRARRLIDALADELASYPQEAEAARCWRQRVGDQVQEFGQRCLGWAAADRGLLPEDRFVDATVGFVRRARAFAPDLSEEDLGQALRNVWILNSLQVLFGLPVETTPAVFAYSMLYPATDNFLDDPGVPADRKRAFNERLGSRLAGAPLVTLHRQERQVFRLVGEIERHYPRSLYPEVYESLRAIHRAQARSLAQQRGESLSDDELLRISVEKGGSSVLADGYLAAGRLTPRQEEFCFGYGVALQLLDDLQDLRGDAAAGHRTLFSVPTGPLDRRAARLHRFLRPILERVGDLGPTRHERLGELIRGSCLFLLVGAIAEEPERFTPRFRRRLERHWPFGLTAMRRLRRRIERRRAVLARGRPWDTSLMSHGPAEDLARGPKVVEAHPLG